MPFVALSRLLPVFWLGALLMLSACASTLEPDRVNGNLPEQSPAERYGSEEAYEEATFDEETIIDKATGALGAGAEEVAGAIESLFSRYGRPTAYIAGSEIGGGLILSLRYGGGTLTHKIEGDRPIHWTGPGFGIDVGADAVKTFALVYDLHDTEELYRRIAAIEGSFYYVGGLGISVYKAKHAVVATVRFGAGLRAQASLGYIKYTKERTINPF